MAKGKRAPAQAPLLTSAGDTIRMGDVLGERPVLLVPIYTQCPHTCPMLRRAVERLWREVPEILGQVKVVFVTFDPTDAPARMRAFERRYAFEAKGWRLVRTLRPGALFAVLGFKYEPLPNGLFAHDNTFFVLDREGRVIREFRDVQMDVDDFRAAVQAAHYGRPLPPVINELWLSCLRFDPATGTYRFDTSLIAMLVASVASFIVFLVWIKVAVFSSR